jgi:hypothetical protein
MARVRIIHMDKSSRDLISEQLYFTEDLKTKSKDFLPPGYVVVSDTVHDIEIPQSFPMESTFVRMG